MRVRCLLLGCLGWVAGWSAEVAVPAGLPADELVRRGLAAEAAQQPQEALRWFRAAAEVRPGDATIVQKISKQLSDSTLGAGTLDEKRALAREALALAEEAVRLAPGDPVNVLSVAICYGKLSLYADNRTKVDYARRVKEHAEAALVLNPDYDWAHHVLGRWHVGVVELGGTKRFFAGLLYGRLPPGSLEEGLRHLERAVALAPEVVAHRVELGFALRAAGRLPEARAQWEQALALPSREIHDQDSKRRAQAALAGGR